MKKSLITAVLLAVVSMGAMAAEQGGYLGTEVGLAPTTNSNSNSSLSGTALGVGIVMGYNMNKYVGIEGGLNLLGVVGWNNVMALPISVAAVGYAPIGEQTSLYGKVGASYTTILYSANSISGITSMYGVGIELAPKGKQSLHIGVDHYDLSVETGMSVSTNYIGMALVEHF